MSSAALIVAVCGCQPEYHTFAESGTPLGLAAYFPNDQPSVTRAQKPEGSGSGQGNGSAAITQVSLSNDGPKVGEINARIWATVNGTPILETELRHSLFLEIMRMGADPNAKQKLAEMYASQLQLLIDNELLLQDLNTQFGKTPAGKRTLDKLEEEADREFDKFQAWLRKDVYRVPTDDDLKALLIRSGFTLEGLRRQQQRSLMAMEYTHFLADTSKDIGVRQLYEYYQQHVEEFTPQVDSYEWEDIFLDFSKYPEPQRENAIARATDIVQRLRSGAKIGDLLKYDDGDSRARNGRGSGTHPGEIQPAEVEPELSQLKDGQVGRLVVLQTGIHIVRLVRKKNAHELQPFNEETQKLIRDKLRKELMDHERKRVVEDLRRKANVEITKPEK
jgi:hypothetical protein